MILPQSQMLIKCQESHLEASHTFWYMVIQPLSKLLLNGQKNGFLGTLEATFAAFGRYEPMVSIIGVLQTVQICQNHRTAI